MRKRLGLLATVVGLFAATTAHAGHHLWDFTEMFSNASGTIQFFELFTADNNEQGVGAFGVTSTTHSMSFVTNLPTATTANTWILCATSNLAGQVGGVTPDYIIAANFFPTAGGTLNYAGGADIWNYGAVPTDGVHSLARNASTPVNSPTNFAGQAGSINVGAAVPMTQTWGLVLLVGAMLLVGSGLLRKRENTTTA